MANEKLSWEGIKQGFLSIISRNALLVIAINLANQYGNGMKNGFRSLIGKDLGMTATAIGFAVTLFSVGSIILRTPAGSLTDTRRSKLKYFLAAGGLIKAFVFIAYGFVSSPVAYDVLLFIDGAVYAYITTMVPACLALSVDRRAMGSAYAIYMSLMTAVSGISKASGIFLYNTYGQTTASLITAATSILVVVLALCIDGKKWEVLPASGEAKAPAKKGLLSGFNVKMLPLAICCALCIVAQTIDSTFAPIYSTEMGFDYATAIATSGVAYGAVTFIVTILCDFVNPSIMIFITMGGMIIGNILMAAGTTNAVFCTGVWFYNLCRCYNSPFKVIGMKAVSKSDQGSLQATMLLMTDIVTLFASTIGGFVADMVGYTGAYWFSVIVLVFNLVLFTVLKIRGTFDYRQPQEAESTKA